MGELVLILIGVTSGLIAGVWGTCIRGLRKGQRAPAELLLLALTVIPSA